MKTCPKCGADNRPNATECRLCATPLEIKADPPPAAVVLAPTVPVSLPQGASGVAVERPAGQIICPSCHADNEPDWVFCQQCGRKLRDQEGAVPSAAGADAGLAGSGKPGEAEPSAPPKVKPDTGRVSAPPATKVDHPSPTPPAPLIADKSGKDKPASAPAGPAGPAAVPAPPPPAPKPVVANEAAQPAAPPLAAGQSWRTAASCTHCGEAIPSGALYCANCGRAVSEPPPESAPGAGNAVIQIISEGGQVGETYPIIRGDIRIGRVEGDVTFPHDGYMSGRHAQIVERDGHYFLVDQNSRNGTFIRIHDETELKPGDTFLVGKQVFKFDKK
ncbi:MAG TPA: zinc-ribbon domain-containing protein [Blastocatellia bacterium]|nr:zinc-ribbon domain-containing protein [Blastocatellia bacterium]